MSTLRKLRRKEHSTRYGIEPFGTRPLLLERKISELLKDYAEPILEVIDDDRDFKAAITFSALCWNLSLLPSEDQRAHLNDALNAIAGTDLFKRHGIQQYIQMLLDRKEALFADDKRLIVDYEVVEDTAGPRLQVTSTPVEDGHAVSPWAARSD